MTGPWLWGGYKDNSQLVPRPSDPRVFPDQELIDSLGRGGYRATIMDTVEYMASHTGYRMIASWGYRRPLDRWE